MRINDERLILFWAKCNFNFKFKLMHDRFSHHFEFDNYNKKCIHNTHTSNYRIIEKYIMLYLDLYLIHSLVRM